MRYCYQHFLFFTVFHNSILCYSESFHARIHINIVPVSSLVFWNICNIYFVQYITLRLTFTLSSSFHIIMLHSMFLYMFVCLFVCISMCMCTWVFVCVCVSMCVYVCVYVCRFVFVHACLLISRSLNLWLKVFFHYRPFLISFSLEDIWILILNLRPKTTIIPVAVAVLGWAWGIIPN